MRRLLGALLLMLTACRPEPGPSDYENQGGFSQTDAGTDPNAGMLPGPFPYQEGQRRLAVGVFYEGKRSEEVVLDNTSTHVYLYENTVMLEGVDTRVEGRQADRVVHAGKTWLGFGVHWDTARSLDGWKTLHVSLSSADPGFADVKVGMNDAKSIQLAVTKYGYVNDGEWHHLAIPLADFTAAGLKLNAIQAPFVFIAGQGAAGQTLLIDNLYFTAE
jgi:hypothetical protein